MQPLDLVGRVVTEVTPYLPQAAQAGVRLGRAGDARALFVVIERAVRLYHQETVLADFVAHPHGRGGARLRQVLHEVVRADPMLAVDLQSKLDALLGQNTLAADPATVAVGPRAVAVSAGPAPATRTAGGPVPYPYPTTAYAPGPPATIGDRFLARLIDTGVLFGVLVVFALCSDALDESAHPAAVFFAVVALAALFGYEFAAVGWYGKTIGKHVMKLRIVKLSGAPAGWGAAAVRAFVPMPVNCLTCGILGNLCYLSPLFDNGPYKRGWLDQMGGTVVVREPR